jgi:hypothetical protein
LFRDVVENARDDFIRRFAVKHFASRRPVARKQQRRDNTRRACLLKQRRSVGGELRRRFADFARFKVEQVNRFFAVVFERFKPNVCGSKRDGFEFVAHKFDAFLAMKFRGRFGAYLIRRPLNLVGVVFCQLRNGSVGQRRRQRFVHYRAAFNVRAFRR